MDIRKDFTDREFNGSTKDWKCHLCGEPGQKTDGLSRVWCSDCINKEIKAYRQPVQRSEPKIGRNQPCHCGSVLKYKKCHGKN